MKRESDEAMKRQSSQASQVLQVRLRFTAVPISGEPRQLISCVERTLAMCAEY